jgi:hypothetical protein
MGVISPGPRRVHLGSNLRIERTFSVSIMPRSGQTRSVPTLACLTRETTGFDS